MSPEEAEPISDDVSTTVSPFEGPEKLLEVWFAPSVDHVRGNDDPVDDHGTTRIGLRRVSRQDWEAMLEIVKCQVLSVIHGTEIDAYLLSESSLFVFPHKLILKTCGTTLNLLGLPRILQIAATSLPSRLPSVHRLFYSRKSFMFPERQQGPHREWKEEVQYLDTLLASGVDSPSPRGNGGAYTVGSVNRDHWVLYLTGPPEDEEEEESDSADGDESGRSSTPSHKPSEPTLPDFTLEILMSRLGANERGRFYFPSTAAEGAGTGCHPTPNHEHGLAISKELGITDLFPTGQSTLDAFAFEPCGYSANGLVKHEDGEGYWTIHVTPEEGWSYASFECNIPLPAEKPEADGQANDRIPDLETLIQRVVKIFNPGHLSVTAFMSSSSSWDEANAVQKIIKRAVTDVAKGLNYKRVDKIDYELNGYDLAFACFEQRRKSVNLSPRSAMGILPGKIS